MLCMAAGLLSAACTPPEALAPLQITGYNLSSPEPGKLASWYVDNLGFDLKKEDDHQSLTHGEISIKLVSQEEKTSTVTQGQKQPGFFKVGFKTPDLDVLHDRLLANGSTFKGGVFNDNNLQMRSLVVFDTDGNRVQFFEDPSIDQLQPYFFSIMAMDFEQTKSWVESEFGFKEIHQLDLPERGFLIRLMEKDGVLLELISDERLTKNSSPLPGIEGIVFNRSGQRNRSGELKYDGI